MPFPMPYIPPPASPERHEGVHLFASHLSLALLFLIRDLFARGPFPTHPPARSRYQTDALARDRRRITSGYVPKFSSAAREGAHVALASGASGDGAHLRCGRRGYTPSPKQREKMERIQRRREKYLKHHDHDHDAALRTGKNESSRCHHEHRPRHFSSNSTSPGRSTPSRRHSSKARRHRSSFRNGHPYYVPQLRVHSRTRTRTEHSQCT